MEAILAVDINNGLSKNSLIPWKSKKDINFFFNKTKNNVVIMGKNTYFSLPEENRPLKNRLNIVLTNNPNSFLLDDTISKYNNVIFTNDDEIYTSILIDREKYLLSYPSLNRDFKISKFSFFDSSLKRSEFVFSESLNRASCLIK